MILYHAQGRITKVLNMKPPEILGMIEEAAGTRMFEQKKQASLKTIERKQTKVQYSSIVQHSKDVQLLSLCVIQPGQPPYGTLCLVMYALWSSGCSDTLERMVLYALRRDRQCRIARGASPRLSNSIMSNIHW